MFCERLINIYRRHPSFAPVASIEELLRQEIGVWPAGGEERPDSTCLEEAWEFGLRKVADQQALPQDVATCLSVPIRVGGIDPFGGLRPENVDSHMLTSRAKVSLELCRILRGAERIVIASTGTSPSTLVRAVVLGFRWNEQLPEGGDLGHAARSATSADLLLAYRFASAMAADRVGATDPELRQSVVDLRAITDGIVRCLQDRGHEGGDAEARRVVRVIELERVVQAMVDLLTKSGTELETALPRIQVDFGLTRPDGPISHLREYVARGAPLNDLVGHEQQADVRRDIERIMEPVTDAQLPGFPSINLTSRRASELLRRLRFLVRTMLLKASEPNALPVYRQFRRDLFHGADSDCQLAAARIAFERAAGGDSALGMRATRAQLQNLAAESRFIGCSAALAGDHAFVRALRGAVKIELDTWSSSRDGDSTAFVQAVVDVVRGAEATIPGLGTNSLVHRVFDGEVLVAMEKEERREDRRQPRCTLFTSLKSERVRDRVFDPSVPIIRRAIQGGLRAFQDLIRANFHREFDRAALHRIVAMDVFQNFDRDQNSKVGMACRDWLESWAYVSPFRSTFDSAKTLVGEGVTSGALAAQAVAQPYRQDDYSGGSLMFRYADAAADRHLAAKTALEEILLGGSAREVIDASGSDKLGRSIGMVLAQCASRAVLEHLYGPGRPFRVAFASSVDGVTPTMAAVRFGEGAVDDLEQRQRMREVLRHDTHHHGKDPRDDRGWRAIHHAFAAGNVAAAEMLVAHDRSCLKWQEDDRTTFLIEAVRCKPAGRDPSEVFLKAVDLLSALDAQDQEKILKFKGEAGLDGTPLSLVSAALASEGGRWPMLVSSLENPDHREAILSVISELELSKLLRDDDDSRLASFCQQLSHAPQGRAKIAEFLSKIEPSASSLVLSLVKSADSAIAARGKCLTLRAHDALDLSRVDPFSRDNALHHLVRAVEKRPDVDAFSGKLYSLAWDVIRAESPDRRRDLVGSMNLDGESPVWLASRLGVPALAVAYAQFLGNISGSSDERWLEAARVIKDPGRYQDGIPENRRLIVGADRMLFLSAGSGQGKTLSKRPLPVDLNTRSARTWLLENAMEVACSLKEHFGLNSDIPHYAFVNWLAHLSSERAPGHGAGR
jgi:hypothetical protein